MYHNIYINLAVDKKLCIRLAELRPFATVGVNF